MEQLRDSNIASTLELKAEDAQHDRPVRFVGLIASLRKIPTKNRDMMCVATLEDRFGTMDAVLFPRTWNSYEHLMEEGAVVVIGGKLDLKRNEPQIICESVTNQIETVSSDGAYDNLPPPPASFIPDEDDAWSAPVSSSENGNGSGQGYGNGNGSRAYTNGSNGSSYAAAPVSSEPPSWDELPPMSDEEWNSTRPPETIAPLEPSQKLRVRFHRNGDEGRDRRRLERLVGILTQQHGQDHFEIVLVTEGMETHLMAFPNHTTHYGEKLLKELNQIPGIEIVPVSGDSPA